MKYVALVLLFALSACGYNRDEIYKKYEKSVVAVLINESGGGTGFIIKAASGNNILVTNAHVCSGMNEVKLQSRYLPRLKVARVIEKKGVHDLCAIEAPPTLPAVTLGSRGPEITDHVYAVGHPLLLGLTVSEGHIRSFGSYQIGERCPAPLDFLMCPGEPEEGVESSLVIYPGNSGSPMVNDLGQVVGVMFAGMQGSAIAIPYRFLKAFLSVY